MSPKPNPRVLYIIGQLQRGGAEQQLYYLLREWAHDASVIVLERNPQHGYWAQPIRDLGYEVLELARHGHFDIRRLGNLLHQIRLLQPDIIHLFNDSRSNFYGRMATLLTRTSCVIVNERRHPLADPKWYRSLKRWWLNHHIAAMVANARSSLDFAITQLRFPPYKAHYIPNGLDLTRFQRDPDLDARALLPDDWRDKIIVGTVGSLLSKKAPDVYVHAARHIVDIYPDARFLHIGKGPLLSSVKALQNDLGLSDHMEFMGQRLDVPQLLQAMDVFVMTSRNEGMPNAVMEAMAMQLPCVVTDAGDSRDIVIDGRTGFVVPVGDINSLTERILTLVTDPAMRKRFGEQGNSVIQDFSTQRMAERYKQLYSELLATNS